MTTLRRTDGSQQLRKEVRFEEVLRMAAGSV